MSHQSNVLVCHRFLLHLGFRDPFPHLSLSASGLVIGPIGRMVVRWMRLVSVRSGLGASRRHPDKLWQTGPSPTADCSSSALPATPAESGSGRGRRQGSAAFFF